MTCFRFGTEKSEAVLQYASTLAPTFTVDVVEVVGWKWTVPVETLKEKKVALPR